MLYILVFLFICGALVVLHPEGKKGEVNYTVKMLHPPAAIFALLLFLSIGDYSTAGFELKLQTAALGFIIHYGINGLRLGWYIWRGIPIRSEGYWVAYVLFYFILAVVLLFTIGQVLDMPDDTPQVVSLGTDAKR